MGGSAEDRLEALRLLMRSLGDFRLKDPPAEVYTAYSLQGPVHEYENDLKRVLPVIRGECLTGGGTPLDDESARFLAMVEDDDDAVAARVASAWGPTSSATRDMHYLVVYSRLRGKRGPDAAAKVADAVLGLDRKLEGQAQRNKQNWNARLVEVVTELVKKDPRLPDALLHHKDFVRPRTSP